jgi:hypothetical protein
MSHTLILGRRRQAAPGPGLLGGGLDSPRPDEDTAATMARVSRTFWTSRRGFGPISSPPMHMEGSSSLSRPRATSIGGSCWDGPVGSPPLAERHFNQRSPTVDPVDRGAMSRGTKGVVCGGDGGGRAAPRSISPSPEDTDLARTSVPCFFATRLAVH